MLKYVCVFLLLYMSLLICIVCLKRVVKTEDKYALFSVKGRIEHWNIIKHSLNNGTVLTMENSALRNALMLAGFVH